MSWLIGKVALVVGERFARPALIAFAVLLLVGGIFLLGRCSTGDDYEDDYRAQIDQTTRSSDAIAEAAKGAIETLEDRTATEDAIDQVVTETVAEIGNAQSADAVRAAVIAGVCAQPSHRNDPACQISVRREE